MISKVKASERLSVFGFVILFAVGLVATGPAAAAGPAGPGSTFSTSYVDLPADAIPGGASAYASDSAVESPLSSDGRYMAFISDANKMAPKVNPDVSNVFRKDRTTGEVEFVSRASGDVQGPGASSREPAISGDGNRVAFVTDAQLDPADTDTSSDVYYRDINTGITKLATPGTTLPVFMFDLSANGVFITYVTAESLLPANDPGTLSDAYRRNLDTNENVLVSRAAASLNSANGNTSEVSISGNGQWIAFSSSATNLVAGFADGNGPSSNDIYVRNMDVATNYLVSARHNNSSAGGNSESQEPDIAGTPVTLNEVRTAYATRATDVAAPGIDTDSNTSVYLRSFPAVPSVLISRASGVAGANADSRAHTPSLSDDGNIVGFTSDAGNLGAGADYYGTYYRNLSDQSTTLGSVRNSYAVQISVSGDGSTISWMESGATPDSDPDLPSAYTRTIPGGPAALSSRPAGTKRFLFNGIRVSSPSSGTQQISDDGRYTVFAGSSPLVPPFTQSNHIYRRDNQTGALELASRESGANGLPSASGSQSPSISDDGSRVAFESYAPLVPADTNAGTDVYVRDFDTDTTILVSRGEGVDGAVADSSSGGSSISGDGNRVAFSSNATNLGDPAAGTHVYVRDLAAGSTVIASRADGAGGLLSDGSSGHARLSDNGQRVVFDSSATNLDPADTGVDRDIYVRDLTNNTLLLASRQNGLDGVKSTDYSYDPAISGDGKIIAFEAQDPSLATEAGAWPAGTTQIVSRVVDTGSNQLVSRAPGGAPGSHSSREPGIDDDGSSIAFESKSMNLLASVALEERISVYVRDSTTGSLSAPPGFGFAEVIRWGSENPSISGNGNCLAFTGSGFNEASGDASDEDGTYVHVLSGTCLNPRGTNPAPVLSKVSLKPKKFAVGKKPTVTASAKKGKKRAPKGTKIRFTIDRSASVTIRIDRMVNGRKSKGKCRKVTKGNKRGKKCLRPVKVGKLVRGNQKAGARVVPFSGRIGKKKLKPGKYRASVTAYNAGGGSKTINRPFVIVKR